MNKNKAQIASYESAKNAQQNNKQDWLELFSEDAIVQDPVGKSPLDPVGDGHKGKKAISDFYDSTIAVGQLKMEIVNSFPAGDECANLVKLTNTYPDGTVINVEMIAVYKANDEGKLVSLKAYWEFDEVMKQFG